jgi:HemY protein
MIQVFVFVLCVVAAALGLAWFADRPGSVNIEWLGYQIETSAFVATIGILLLVALLLMLWSLLRFLATRPAAIASHLKERRRKQGFEALTRGLVAIGVGDRLLAQKYAGVARRTLPNEPLTALLRAQAAQLKGDSNASRRAFEAMLDRPETELLGLRGLFLEAGRRGDGEAARAFVEQAVKRDPQLGWGVNALFEMQARAGDWPGALDTLAIARQQGHVDSLTAQRRRAVLLTAEALDVETESPERALSLATEALKLAPSLVPAADIAGRILATKGESRLASRLIARTWKLSAHPDLAIVYAYAKPGDSPRERLKRVKYLASLTPTDIEGNIAVAVAAIEAHEWEEARNALAPYLEDRPPARVCALMASIEAGEGDKGREREWLARGLRAPRDRAWIANNYVSDRWLPVSPVSGMVDAFEWKAPVDAIGRGDESLLIEDRFEEPVRGTPSGRIETNPGPVIDLSETTSVTEPPSPPPEPKRPPSPRAAEIYSPPRAPDDPGPAPGDADESPTSLERFRTAHIR